MSEERELTYAELVNRVKFLEAKLTEMENNNLWIRKEPTTSVPTEMDGGKAVIFDDGTDQKLYYNGRNGIKSLAFS
ncbi:MAG: hypothetical protein C4542_04365 [Dehalococcoidia bacterium]|nr:MAG: hypothetical protein C4542_04365 [Dehalococcoidia bacterium]